MARRRSEENSGERANFGLLALNEEIVTPEASTGPDQRGRSASAVSTGQRRPGLVIGRAGVIGLRIGAVALVLAIWQAMSGRVLPVYTVSRPTSIVKAFAAYISTAAAWVDIRTTTEEYLLGLAAGALLGLVVAATLASVSILGRIFEPIIAALNAVPVVALAPLFIILFGIGITSKVVIAAVAVFFIMFYNTYIGIINVPEDLLNTLKTFGAGRRAQLRHVILPSVAPEIFAALRVSVGIAMIGVIVGEFVAAVNGVGQYIDNQTQLFNTHNTFAGIIVAVLIVLLCRGVVLLLERRVTRWRRVS